MSFNDQDVQQVNAKLDDIQRKVTVNKLELWWNRLKYAAVGIAWIVGAASHKWGLFHFLSKLTD
jgi:hypothetical protein